MNVDYISDSDSEYDDSHDDRDFVYDGASEYIVPGTPEEDDRQRVGAIKVTLKNQDQFDDESCVSKPLLDMNKEWLHRAWRQQYAEKLGSWGLISAKAEVLKFNGLVSYFPHEGSRVGSRAGSVYLALDKGDGKAEEGSASRHLSRASSTLIPPLMTRSYYSPGASPRHFSFNPEATEFRPGIGMTTNTGPGQFTDVSTSIEQYLRISMPVVMPAEIDESLAGMGVSSGHNRLLAPQGKPSRPSLSRDNSNVSGTSSWGGERPTVKTTSQTKAAKADPVYSCSICWIRVAGRFYLCPTCGHVTHFDCMDDGLGMEDGDCVVGCGCGCGLEFDDPRSRMEQYLEEVRAANAAGMGWEEGSEWLHMVSDSQPETPEVHLESMFGDFMTGGASKMAVTNGDDNKRKKEKVGDRSSPTVGGKKREKGKGKRRVQASALSYY